jgi:hypothetical protein
MQNPMHKPLVTSYADDHLTYGFKRASDLLAEDGRSDQKKKRRLSTLNFAETSQELMTREGDSAPIHSQHVLDKPYTPSFPFSKHVPIDTKNVETEPSKTQHQNAIDTSDTTIAGNVENTTQQQAVADDTEELRRWLLSEFGDCVQLV